jgi:hypothetical protein
MRAERKPKLHVQTRDLYVRVNRDCVFVCVCVCFEVDGEEGRVHVESEAGGDIPTRCVDEYMSTRQERTGREGKVMTDLSRFARRWRKVQHTWPWQRAGSTRRRWPVDGGRTVEGGVAAGVLRSRRSVGIGVRLTPRCR